MFGEIEVRFAASTYGELVQKIAEWLEKGKHSAPPQPQQTQTPATMPAQPVYQHPQMATTTTVAKAPQPVYPQPAPANAMPFPGYAQPPIYQPQAPVAPTAPMAPPAAPDPTPAPIPSAAPAYSLEDLMRAASSVIDAGKMQDLHDLLGQHGVQAMTQLPPEQYGNFAAALRSLGAQL